MRTQRAAGGGTELRRLNEHVAAQRRALPAGGLIREDYVFESAADGSKVRFSQLFAPGKNSLVIYNMMFPRWSEDPRAGAPGGKTAELPLVEQPCPSCTSVVDGLEGAAFHLAERINLVVIAKTSPDRLGTYAQERGWRNLRLLSSRNNTFNRDYHAEASDGGQLPVLERVLTRRGRDPPPLGERDDVQARRHQLPRPGLANLRRSRFDARWTRRQRCLPQPAVLGSPRILARLHSGGPEKNGSLALGTRHGCPHLQCTRAARAVPPPRRTRVETYARAKIQQQHFGSPPSTAMRSRPMGHERQTRQSATTQTHHNSLQLTSSRLSCELRRLLLLSNSKGALANFSHDCPITVALAPN